jgi:hypothetical protein
MPSPQSRPRNAPAERHLGDARQKASQSGPHDFRHGPARFLLASMDLLITSRVVAASALALYGLKRLPSSPGWATPRCFSISAPTCRGAPSNVGSNVDCMKHVIECAWQAWMRWMLPSASATKARAGSIGNTAASWDSRRGGTCGHYIPPAVIKQGAGVTCGSAKAKRFK